MSVRELPSKPDSMSHFPDDAGYRWLELHDNDTPYGHAATAERDDTLELHVTLTRWGSRVRRNLYGDVTWLKTEAKRLGKSRIMGIRADNQEKFDPRLFKFARMFGFTETGVFQTAIIML
ncbi:MAG: hypothetical protein JEY79_01935 [Pseudodesulfovibrio sp.]|nr:hypothetical protein [Pseudodesulfovibrio sp.]